MSNPRHTTDGVISLRELGLQAGQFESRRVPLAVDPYRIGKDVMFAPRELVDARVDITAMVSGNAFRLRFSCELEGPCSRCLEPAAVHVDVDSHEVNDPAAGDEELVSEFVDDAASTLDVGAWAQETVALAMPTAPLCRVDCAGLCAQCGTNLNEGSCDCIVETHDPRWDALKGLDLGE